MRVPCKYGSALDMYTWQNNYLNNFCTHVGGACEFHAYPGERQTYINSKIIILIILNPKYVGVASSTRRRGM